MIRRGFWLATGAVLGVTGYRRATRLARLLSAPKTATLAPAPRARTRALPSGGQAAISQGRTVGRVAAGGLRTGAARAVAAAGFMRDVRDGMAEYRDLHRGTPDPVRDGRTLEGPSDRAWSGERQQRRREP